MQLKRNLSTFGGPLRTAQILTPDWPCTRAVLLIWFRAKLVRPGENVPMAFDVSVRKALNNNTDALQVLASHLPENLRAAHVLSLPPPRAQNNTQSTLLVGRLLPGTDGSLVISHSRKNYCHIVIAPPLSSDSRAALIYCSDYRLVQLQNSRSVIEVLSDQVHVLATCDYYAKPPSHLRFLSLTAAGAYPCQINDSNAIVSIVTAKSPIFGSNDSCFIIELCNFVDNQAKTEHVSVTVLFSGRSSLKWWPFIHPGRRLAFVGLKRAVLPAYGHRLIFKVSDDTTLIYSCPSEKAETLSITQNLPVESNSDSDTRKRKRCCEDSPACKTNPVVSGTSSAFYRAQHTVSYEGVITECLSDGRIRLDDSVFLHLGGDCSWFSNGPKSSVCARIGARIEACNVSIGYQRGVATTLFPTGRTTIYFLYFGNLSDSMPCPISDWHKSPWFRYWNLLPAEYALWCQELYDTLVLKFRLWFASTPTSTNTSRMQVDPHLGVYQLLGTEKEPGLLEFLMEKVSGLENLFERRQMRTHFYDEFFGNRPKKTSCEIEADIELKNSFPYMPALNELASAVDVKWLSSQSAAVRDQQCEVIHSSSLKGDILVETFTPVELAAAVSIRGWSEAQRLPLEIGRIRSNTKLQIHDVILVGVIEGCGTDDASLLLHDASGFVYCECDKVLDPALIGAVVVIRSFLVVVEFFLRTHERETTFLFRLSDLQVVVDGPAAVYESESINRPLSQSGFRKSDGSSLQIAHSFENNSNELLEDFPLAFVLIEQVSCITLHSDGNPHFRIVGRLLGAAESSNATQWMVLSGEDGQFWNCFFVIHGDAAVKIRPSLNEGSSYGIACTDFKDCPNIPKLCEDRADRSCTSPHSVALFSTSSSTGLWLQKLNDDNFLKFKPGKKCSVSSVDGVNNDDTVNNFGISYQCWKSRHLLDLLSPYWKTTKQFESGLVSFTGVFLRLCHLSENELFRESECAWSSTNWSMLILEKETCLFRVEVVFFGNCSRPRALIPGSTVFVRNVKRRVSNNGRLLFTACETTRIRIVEFGDTALSVSSALCCNRLEQSIDSLTFRFGSSFLWNFTAAVGLGPLKNSFKMCASIRLSILELKHIEFSYSEDVRGCEFCRALDGTDRCIEARAVAIVDDGTSRGNLECCTFRTVMELLGAGDEERNKFRSSLPSCDRLLTPTVSGERNYSCMSRESDFALKQLIHKSSLQRSVNVLVRNLVNNEPTSSISRMINEASTHGHNVGYGRKLWTAEAPCLHSVSLEALIIYQDDAS